ncbi:MAG: hypothetical protein HY231_12580 [Acidobacteria bacterium]|nr:hypothetical protein [Acidobacteriota bacterium]
MNQERKLSCKAARQRFADLSKTHRDEASAATDQPALQAHLNDCSSCKQEYRLASLMRLTFDLAASPTVIEPSQEFFVALKARLARGPEPLSLTRSNNEESWSATLWLTARQMIPALAMLLLLIIGATVLWNQSPTPNRGLDPQTVEAQSKVRGLTASDVLDTIVGEEKDDDK